VRDGWVNKETGKKSEPRIQFLEVKQLQDVLESYAKKLTLLLDIKDIRNDFVHQLSHVFQVNKGDHSVAFEVMETEQVRRTIEVAPIEINDEVLPDDDTEIEVAAEVEETRIVTKLSMPSRKVRVKICTELLGELDRMQVNFKLN
jgi:DNA polymerase-3 subunit alpha